MTLGPEHYTWPCISDHLIHYVFHCGFHSHTTVLFFNEGGGGLEILSEGGWLKGFLLFNSSINVRVKAIGVGCFSSHRHSTFLNQIGDGVQNKHIDFLAPSEVQFKEFSEGS